VTVFKYPLRPPSPDIGKDEQFPTEAVDYVMLHRFRIKYDDKDTGYAGLNVPSSTVKRELNKSRVYIAMPKAVQTAYQASYSKVDLGIGGVMAAGLVGSGSTGGLNFEKVADAIQKGAQAGLPQGTANIIANVAGAANKMTGVGGGPNANQLMGLSQGRVFNPFSEQIFNSMSFRTHSFSFKMFARSKKEANEIFQIARYLKTGAHPKVAGGSANMFDLKSDISALQDKNLDTEDKQRLEGLEALDSLNGIDALTSGRYFEVPDKYRIKFIRMDPNAGTVESQHPELHFRIEDSVCTSMAVNYTPDGQYSSFKDLKDGTTLSVPAIQIDMSFTETKLLSQADVEAGY
tara:strand:- start:637 stop:1677 length:1041 start_codon:yes stop_codon:yes gene_type:complete